MAPETKQWHHAESSISKGNGHWLPGFLALKVSAAYARCANTMLPSLLLTMGPPIVCKDASTCCMIELGFLDNWQPLMEYLVLSKR